MRTTARTVRPRRWHFTTVDRHAQICRMHFVDRKPLAALGHEFFLTTERIWQITNPVRVMLANPEVRAVLREMEARRRRAALEKRDAAVKS